MPCQDVIFNFSGRWIRRAEPLRLFPCRHVWRLKRSAPRLYPTLFLSTVSRVGQAHSAWCSALSRGSPTEIRRRSSFKFPSPQEKLSNFRSQRDASLNPCDSLSATSAQWPGLKDPLPSKTTMLPLSMIPDTASKGLRTLAPWNARLEMSPPPCCSVRTFTVFTSRAHVSLSFH